VIAEMKRAGIGTSVHWMPLHMHPYYRPGPGRDSSDFPCATTVYPGLISLPLYPEMTDGEVESVCQTLKDIIARSRVAVPVTGLPVLQH
jgi:perosamine synthetase